jgi:hypothetical protein
MRSRAIIFGLWIPDCLQAAAWSELLSDLDERLKAKKCSLDDIHRAVALLPCSQQQVGMH